MSPRLRFTQRAPSLEDINDVGKNWPVRYEAIAMWALVEASGKRQITGIHLRDLFQMQYCNQFHGILVLSQEN